MIKKCVLFIAIFCSMLLLSINLFAQEGKSGVIVNIEGSKVYVDITSKSTKVHDVFNVYSEGGYFIHPITKKKIKKDQEVVGKIEIVSTHEEYSEAVPVPQQSIKRMQTGMEIRKIDATDTSSTGNIISEKEDRVAVVIAPAQVNDVVNNGYFGGYVADILMEQLMTNNRIKLLDRSVLNAQIDESNLQGDCIDPNTAIERGKISGAQYIIQLTMQKPDVVNVNTGVPLASIMGAAQAATGKNLGAQYMSNANVSILKAFVTITARIIDLQTGEVVFMCSGKGDAKGKNQVSMESGALGGAQINGGAEGFKQTVAGQAIQKAFMVIGKSLNDHFNGKTTAKVVGSATGFGYNGQKLTLRKRHIYNGVDKLSNDDVKTLFINQPELYFKYKKARNSLWQPWACYIGFTISAVLLCNYEENKLFASPDHTIEILGSCLCVGGEITLGYLLRHNIHKKLQNIVNQYNSSLSQSYIKPKVNNTIALNLVSDNNGLGLRLSF